MPIAAVGDIDIYYEVAGAGSRLLFIGGTGGDLRQGLGVLDGPLPEQFEVLVFDQRGLGRTSKPEGPYEMQDYGDDVAGLLDVLGWDSALVIGVSFGGMVAQELALRHPGRVRRLVLACTSSGGRGGASYPLHGLGDLDPRERARTQISISDRANDKAWQRENPEAANAMIEFVVQRQPSPDDAAALTGARLQLDARSRHDTWDRLPGLDVPTLICAGERDGIAPPENQEALASQISGSRLAFFDGGHMFLLQDRTAFSRIVEFLSEP
ncbi:MAG: alpha/beta fold hydrolase [Candidatus Binatia bacterium]|nr:alpha/beta fold hydrolase [Candidatus Binatia bacterium]